MIKAFIFDLDGTIVNTELTHYKAWERTLLNNGLAEFTLDTFLKYVGTSNEKVASDYAGTDGCSKSVIELVLEKQAIYLELIPEIQLCSGVREILSRFENQMVMAVASSSHQREVREILELHGLADYFSQVVCGDMVERKKPHPEIYLKTQALLNVPVQECVAFEDSSHGLNAAKNAGMYGVAIPNEFTRDHDFTRADRILLSFAEVTPELVQKMTSANTAPV